MNPLVSIIIPTFNRAHLISETLESIISLNYQNWECIIVDDNSTDTTQEIIEKFIIDSRFKFYKRPNVLAKGANSCRNYGYLKSTGNWIKWFDSDDIFLPNALDFFNDFNNDMGYDVCISKIEIVDFETDLILKNKNIYSENFIEDYIIEKINFYICGPTWKKSFLEKQPELFDENISTLDDWDFNLRMIYQDPKMLFMDEAFIKYRVNANSLSSERDKLNIIEIDSELRAREKHITILDATNKSAKSILVNFTLNRCKYFFREALIKNHSSKFLLFKKLLFYQFKTLNLFGLIKTIFGILIFKIFNKGYKFLK